MSEFSLDRFKYTWKGDWQPSTDYYRDDIIRLNGKSYVCRVQHTSSASFKTDQEQIVPESNPPILDPRWIVMTSSRYFVGNWASETIYNTGDIVQYQGSLYVCQVPHTSTIFYIDMQDVEKTPILNETKWILYALGQGIQNSWNTDTQYGLGAVIKYGGIQYKCIIPHQSNTFENETDNWQIYYEGIEYKSVWQPSTFYKINDIVRYGSSIWKCVESHISDTEELDEIKFNLEIPGSQFEHEWSSTTVYNQGDIVKYGGNIYFAIKNNKDSQPSLSVASATDDSTVNWVLLSKNYNFKGLWDKNYASEFKSGDIVQRGGYLFKAVRDVNLADGDFSSIDYLDTDTWEQVAPGKIFLNQWIENTIYAIGDVVTYFGNAYICNLEHMSSDNNFPGDNGSGYFYWDLLIENFSTAGIQYPGDILTYGLVRENVGDGSTLGYTRVGIGNQNQVLSVSESLEVYWKNIIVDSDTVFVGKHGKDDTGYGFSKEKPFKTVRHACQYVEDFFESGTPAKISVTTGRFEEVGPIILPAGCAIVGDELRSTTIVASGPKQTYSGEYKENYYYATDKLVFLIQDVLYKVPVTKNPNNIYDQNFDIPITIPSIITEILNPLEDYKNYINAQVESGETPEITGSNTLSSTDYQNAVYALTLNENFIIEECVFYLINLFPLYSFDELQVKNDLRYLLRGLKRDALYSGNYGTLIAAEHFSNSINGSKTKDLFRVRDTTGIRQCTIEGLEGTLNPPGVYIQYRKPTGGSCVALDPGWGPDDNRTWIINRSPYIQGVTNIGTACIGKKVDGSLHNGGNRSMVSNDFTQVLSDGIGAWVSNNGKTELVSVFTYYCQIGYYAENGGVIRATNGNNSYGNYGSISEGVDLSEIPQSVLVNNKKNQAQVYSAFAGGSNDNISFFEYSNAGENYTNATADIVGAGADANVKFTDFRDGALFESRLINTKGSGSEGGSGYILLQNSAQITVGASSRILLNSNTTIQFESEIINRRIVIVQGIGVGQYGYISAYDNGTYEATIRKESDDSLGWDHFIPGTTIEANLDGTTVYRIEPRIESNHPGFSATYTDLPQSKEYIDAEFGDITATYTNIILPLGNGTLEVDAVPINARITVVRNGTLYDVTLTNPGAGYTINDTFTINGTDLGGSSPENDLIFTVTETTDDSTDSIVNFTYSGTARNGRYVIISLPNYVAYSDNLTGWEETTLSASLTYTRLVTGKNRFLAIASNTAQYSFSYDGEAWTTRSFPSSQKWIDGIFGKFVNGDEKFVVIAEDTNTVAYSNDGLLWQSSTLPTGDDSTGDQWQAIAFGQDRFVIITGSTTKDVAYSLDGINWTRYNNVLPAGDFNWIGLEYGNNRFVALSSNGDTAFSINGGETWILGTTAPSASGYNDFKYAQGVFLAVSNSNIVATTEDGLVWLNNNLSTIGVWSTVMYSNLSGLPTWYALKNNSTLEGLANIKTGAKAKTRAHITVGGSFDVVKILDPGSGYTDNNPVVLTITDESFTVEVEVENRIGNKVLAQPEFLNRGTGYKVSTSTITIFGDGYADIVPQDNELVLDGVSENIPGPGVQIRIDGILDETTEDPDDLLLFTGVSATDLGDDGSGNGTRTVRFVITPSLRNEYNLAHGTAGTYNIRYSQCRITGHDFLDIGTGNFNQTNYPELYAGGAYFVSAPENEVSEINGGRVFYTSTDQDGNFRTGELFGVNQATGVVTISAEFFELDGLTELSLGGVRLGGTGTVVNEFSTDGTFSADSNNIIPTQRAIATFLAARLSVGGSDLETNNFVAGQVSVGTIDNIITTANGAYLNINTEVNFDGRDDFGNVTAIQGSIISQMLFHRNP